MIIGVGTSQSSGGRVAIYRWCGDGQIGLVSSISLTVTALLVSAGSTSRHILGHWIWVGNLASFTPLPDYYWWIPPFACDCL